MHDAEGHNRHQRFQQRYRAAVDCLRRGLLSQAHAAYRALLADHPDVREGDCAAMAAVLGQTTAQLTRWLVHDAPPNADRAALQDEVLELLLRYLRK